MKTRHELIPIHEKISHEEKEKLFKEMGINFKDIPKILITDPALKDLQDIKTGDIIKIARKSSTAKEVNFFRGVIDA